MYWDVVEVIPEPGYCLFVRFKDGLKGRVQLHPEDLTGVLRPLQDKEFFGTGVYRFRRRCMARRYRPGAGRDVCPFGA